MGLWRGFPEIAIGLCTGLCCEEDGMVGKYLDILLGHPLNNSFTHAARASGERRP